MVVVARWAPLWTLRDEGEGESAVGGGRMRGLHHDVRAHAARLQVKQVHRGGE